MSELADAIAANPHRYDGYTVTPSNEDNPLAQTSYSIVRDLDGTGLGAYATLESVEVIMNEDRRMISELPAGTGWVPPLVNVVSDVPVGQPLPPQV